MEITGIDKLTKWTAVTISRRGLMARLLAASGVALSVRLLEALPAAAAGCTLCYGDCAFSCYVTSGVWCRSPNGVYGSYRECTPPCDEGGQQPTVYICDDGSGWTVCPPC
jgi:hypothetical protein